LRKKINKKSTTRKKTARHSKPPKDFEKKQLELLRDIVSHIAGPSSIDIVDLLYRKENVNEFLIAKKLDVTINQARNILYKLADEGLVSFIRKKDKKNGGWYTYFWTLDIGKSLFNLRNKMTKEIENLEGQLASKQTKQFYYCPNCDLEMSEENALLYDFTCPECGEVFEAKDNTGYVEEMKENVIVLEKKLNLVNQELEFIGKKEEATKERRRKAEEKRKKEERDAKRRKLKRLKRKEELIKKKVKKKKVKKDRTQRGKSKLKKKRSKKRIAREKLKKKVKKKGIKKKAIRKKLLKKKGKKFHKKRKKR